MADLLDSILGSMQKPPSLGAEQKRKAKEQRDILEKQQKAKKRILQEFHEKVHKDVHHFIHESESEKMKFKPMDKVYRAIVHEVADIAGLTSFSFGLDEQDRYVILWKKEFAPCDEELLAYREGKVWDPAQAEITKQKKLQEDKDMNNKTEVMPAYNYKDKYQHLIGREAAKDAAISTFTKRSYGFVSSENKRDQRTIEEVMADSKARKKLKTDIQLEMQNSDSEVLVKNIDSKGMTKNNERLADTDL